MARSTKLVRGFGVWFVGATAALALVTTGTGCLRDEEGAGGSTSAGLSADAGTASAAATTPRAYLVMMKQQADLSPAFGINEWAARGQFVYEALTRTAGATQATTMRTRMNARGARIKPFWVVNGFRIEADEATVEELRRDPAVALVMPEQTMTLPPLVPGQTLAATSGVEWGLTNINAPQVWATFGVRGAGITVANIDSGVEHTHPALVRQYRGAGGNSFVHAYNWFDPSGICPPGLPCDNNRHGTHTMGTIVGDDSAGNQIGVAPEARWIAAKGCQSASCADQFLLDSGQWILAPTDLGGANPRPDLRPHIVNNSWGGSPGNPFYQATVQAWVAAGIFPAFSNGNGGPNCDTATSPGDYPESYSAGAYDITNVLASSSSRGFSALGGGIKPNIAAPGVDVRSAVPGGQYAPLSGTSMASPHVAGTVALLWSAAPSLIGNVAATRALLNQTARDMADVSCGGTAANNNLWGEGRLDAFAAVTQAPRCTAGPLRVCSATVYPSRFEGGVAATGTVVLNGAAPAGGAVVALAASPSALASVPATVTVPAGAISATFPITTARATAETTVTVTATFPAGQSTTATFRLLASPTVAALTLNPASVPGGTTSVGTVTLSGPAPAGGAVVTLGSQSPAVATVPATVTVPAGQITTTFNVTTFSQLRVNRSAISAGFNNVIRVATLSVTRTPFQGNAVFDTTYLVPRCPTVQATCAAGDLVHGRGTIGVGDEEEPNQPNTVLRTCADGEEGDPFIDESLETIRITTVDGTPLAAGKMVRVDATVWVFDFEDNFFDLYFASDANNPAWAYVQTVTATADDLQTVSVTFLLPGGPLPVIRGQWRRPRQTLDPCLVGDFHDRDDLIFAIGAAPPDPVPPTVTLTSPANGAVVPSSVTVTANASDNVAVTRVELLVDGVPRTSDLFAPYSMTVPLPDGTHTVQVKAYDAANNSASSAVISVVSDGTGPTTVITAPAEGAFVRGTINVDVSASDPHGVEHVELSFESVAAGPDTTAPYSIPLDTRRFPDGPIFGHARAFDTLGNEGTSPTTGLTVDNTPPSVALTAPADGATVTGTVTVSAAVTEAFTGVARVEFLLDGVVRSTVTSGPPFSWSWDTSAFAGTHVLAARARDGAGNESTSEPVTVTIQPQAGVLFSDNFETGNAAQWTRHSGTWSVVTDGTRVFAQTNNTGDAKASAGSATWTDQVLEVKVKPTAFNGSNRFVAIFARFQDPLNYYFIALRSNNTLELKRLVNGSSTAMATVTGIAVTVGTTTTLKLEVIGSTLRAYVNGVQRAQATDTRFPAGRIGLGTFNATAVFDDVVVTGGGATGGFAGQASAPAPANGATGVGTSATLGWTAGANATSHDVYFGTTNPPAFRANQTGTTFNPGALAAGTQYFWRVDERNAAGAVTTGAVWRFTTAGGSPPGVASSPTPETGAVDVSQGTPISWTAGAGAASHDVYFGTADPPPFRGNQTGTAFSTGGLLTMGTTFFWRVDERNAAGVTRGPVWSFRTAGFAPPGSPTNPVPPSGATGISAAGLTLGWTPGQGATSHQIFFGPTNPPTFQTSGPITSFATGPLAAGTTYFWRVDALSDFGGLTVGQTWTFTVAGTQQPPAPASNPTPAPGATGVSTEPALLWTAGTGAATHDVRFGLTNPPPFIRNQTQIEFHPGELAAGTQYFWRIDERNAAGVTAGPVWSFTTVSGPPGPASNPSPANGATGVSTTPTLSWTPGTGATARDVQFGTSNPPPLAATQTETTFQPGPLAPGTQYFWRIVERNTAGVTGGPLWSFTTTTPSGPLLSDNFEAGAGQWTPLSGSWSIATEGTNHVFAQTTNTDNARASAGSASWTNQVLEARVRVTAFNGTNRFVAVFARLQDATNYYYIALRSNNTVELKKLVNGASTTLASRALPVTAGTWYTLRLEVVGTSLRAFVDGVLQASATDTQFAAGKVGLGTFNATAVFDDVVVTQ